MISMMGLRPFTSDNKKGVDSLNSQIRKLITLHQIFFGLYKETIIPPISRYYNRRIFFCNSIITKKR
jgi:hypothetical protein